jgi:hypothetical protein
MRVRHGKVLRGIECEGSVERGGCAETGSAG